MTESHHRVVRIPASECVALNSAERAPYLLVIEYLENDLDFSPSRRSNRDLILKLSTGRRNIFIPTDSTSQPERSKTPELTQNTTKLNKEQFIPPEIVLDEAPDEEVDIVDQIFGSTKLNCIDNDQRLENVAPFTPRNIDLDNVAWSSRSPSLQSPKSMNSPTPGTTRVQTDMVQAPKTRHGDLTSLTLDQYAERMNAAAAMLAQLNASLSAQNKGTLNRAPSSRWLWGRSLGVKNEENQEKGSPEQQSSYPNTSPSGLPVAEAERIRDKIMQEMDALEEERMRRMRNGETELSTQSISPGDGRTRMQDEDKIRQVLRKEDPSAAVLTESWEAKKVSMICDSDCTLSKSLRRAEFVRVPLMDI
jgi:hypothetical protein